MADSIKLEVNHNNHPNKDNKKEPKKGDPKPGNQQQPQQNKQPNITQPANNQSAANIKKNDKQGKTLPEPNTQGNKSKNNNNQSPNQLTKDQSSKNIKPKGLINRIESSKQHLYKNIQQLMAEYRKFNDMDFEKHGHNPQKEEIIHQMINYYRNQKKQRRLRKKEIAIRKKQVQKNKLKHSLEIQSARKASVRKAVAGRLGAITDREHKRQQDQKKWEEFYEEFKKRKPMYMSIEQKYQSKVNDQKKQLAKKLKNISRQFEPLDFDEIDDHIERYEKEMEDHKYEKEQERKQMWKVLRQQNEELREMWKGYCHQHVEEERQEKKEKKEQPRLIRQRIKDFQKRLKKHPPKVMKKAEQSQTSLQSIDAKSQNLAKIKRQKFVQGKSMGLVDEYVPKKRTEAEQRQLGNVYLEYLKSLPKRKEDQKPQESDDANETVATDPVKKKIMKAPLQRVVRDYNPLYDDRGKLQSLRIPRNATPFDLNKLFSRIHKADSRIDQDQRLLRYENLPSIGDYHSRQKNINQRLFRSVEHKIGLLDKLVEQQKS